MCQFIQSLGNVNKEIAEKVTPPEILDRFEKLIPYAQLSKEVRAQIARKRLMNYKKYMAEKGYVLRFPESKSKEEWQKNFPRTDYTDVDEISVMIAEKESRGARFIDAFISERIKSNVDSLISERLKKKLENDGVIKIMLEDRALAETEKDMPLVKVEYIPKNKHD